MKPLSVMLPAHTSMMFGAEETGFTETYGMPLNGESNVTARWVTLFAGGVISSYPLSVRDTES